MRSIFKKKVTYPGATIAQKHLTFPNLSRSKLNGNCISYTKICTAGVCTGSQPFLHHLK